MKCVVYLMLRNVEIAWQRERDKIAKITLFLLISTTSKRFITSKNAYIHI